MNRYHRAVGVLAVATATLGACKFGGENTQTNETCWITARTKTAVAYSCEDSNGNHTRDGEDNVPWDLYPNCVAGTAWPACKEAVS